MVPRGAAGWLLAAAVLLGGCGGGTFVAEPGPDQREVGFGAPVTLAARTAGVPGGARYRWEQIGGPDVSDTMRGADGPRLGFVTRPLAQTVVLEDRPHVIAFSPATAGEYRFRLTVEARGRRQRGEALVTAAARNAGVSGTPVGVGVWLAAAPASAYAWRIVKAPPASRAQLAPADGRAARFTPDVPGQYVVEDARSQVQFNLYAGRWADVPKDCGRSACHAPQALGWQRTRHATVMARGLAGELKGRGAYGPACLRCHATGYDETVANGGFDDEARRVGWAVPPAGARAKPLPAPLRPLANVTCISCHGPGKLNYSSLALGRSVTWGVGMCAVCHDAPPQYTHVAEWRDSPMAVRVDRRAGPATTPGCAACHSAQGFIASVRGAPRHAPGLVRAEPVTCPACHDPHAATHPGQLRAPRAELCARCHHAADRPEAAAGPARAPHAPQAQVLAGRGAWPIDGAVPPAGGPHATVEGGCVRCHMAAADRSAGPARVGGHSLRARRGEVENVAACGGHCHPGRARFDLRARADFDGDGVVETNRQEVEGLLAAVKRALDAQVASRGLRGCGGAAAGIGTSHELLVLVDARGVDLGDCDHDGQLAGVERPFVVPPAAADLVPFAYNYLLIARDASRGLHNLPFAVATLQRTLAGLRAAASPRRAATE
ncbi:MAG TPA: cytochrome c3 family protein [Polyangia bacterium]